MVMSLKRPTDSMASMIEVGVSGKVAQVSRDSTTELPVALAAEATTNPVTAARRVNMRTICSKIRAGSGKTKKTFVNTGNLYRKLFRIVLDILGFPINRLGIKRR
jgi:hypothetical protein